MDPMCIWGTEPSSVALAKTSISNVPKQAESKRGVVINPQNYNFKQF